MYSKNLIILLSIFFCSYFSSQKINDENFVIYKLKSEKKLHQTKGLKYQTIHGNSKSERLHNNFEKDLVRFGYIKVDNQKKHQVFEKINSLKEGKNNYETACLQTYRDILIYKDQNNKISKIIKICTSCYSNQIITPENNSELLMNFTDYDSLQELLN
ncbi:hypothetical protein JI747_007805 [Chryseobacterium sp. RG1]|uniref:Uncharacterized protein n=1 Tax=Chryseobacterium tagetis TaxID=2801334 RepID=A0ABS7ZZA8_9FLAO|nr:hypothetical protein [Chryseobacterium tagetis]MCA6067079.1 hypothetical protein [Chryseobacterium tagetis]